MTKLEKKLSAALQACGVAGDARLVAAVSGGADSTAMLDALTRRQQGEIIVAHLNHQLRGAESDEDEAFVWRLAEQRGLRVVSERRAVGELAQAQQRNLEAVAREVRYDFLLRAATATDASFVLTAHTQDDQAETILMRLVRGTGAAGLRGIQVERDLHGSVKLLRPLLGVTRPEVLEHCAQRQLAFRCDSSNLAPALTRNRVRHEVLPILRDLNPQADRNLVRAAALLADDEDFLQQMADDSLNACRVGGALRAAEVSKLPSALRRRVLRSWLQAERGDLLRINAGHISSIENLILRGQSGRRVELPGTGHIALEFGRLSVYPVDKLVGTLATPVALTAGIAQDFGGIRFTLTRHRAAPDDEVNEDNGCFALLQESASIDALHLRVRGPGDAYTPVGRARGTKLKTLMIRHRIPLSQRDTYPVLVTADDRIVWVPWLPVAQEFAADERTKACALVTAYREGVA